jgi:hypothetical protein
MVTRVKKKKKPSIDPKRLYTIPETVQLLRGPTFKIEPGTIKKRCRAKTMSGKRIGPKKVWHVYGSSILDKRKEWGLDE